MHDEAGAAGAHDPADPTPEALPEAAGDDVAAAEPVGGGQTILDRLRDGYAEGQAERRKTIEIAPLKYRDSLAAEFKPTDSSLKRKLIRRANKAGESGYEADMRINSALMADACVQMLFREKPTDEWAPLHTFADKFRNGDPIRFDERLAEVLGMELMGGEDDATICRLVFGDPGIFDAHYMALNGWSLQAFDFEGDDEDEEDEGGDRPT